MTFPWVLDRRLPQPTVKTSSQKEVLS